MRLIYTVILLAVSVMLSAQVDRNLASLSTCTGFAPATSNQFTGTLSNWVDEFNTGYLPTSIQAGDMVLDAFGRSYEVLTINSANFASANVTVEAKETPAQVPTGRGLTWRPIGRNLIPPMPTDNGEISNFLLSLISNHNFRQVANIGGGQVDEISTIADTISIVDPAEGHIAIRTDGTAGFFYDGTRWLSLTGGGGGGGGADDWGSQVVQSDNTLTGDGTAGDPLAVNTSVIATQTYVNDELDDRIEITFEVEAIISTSTVSLPTQVDTRYPIWISRGIGTGYSVAFSGTSADWTISGTTATSNYRPLKVGERFKIIYTQLQ